MTSDTIIAWKAEIGGIFDGFLVEDDVTQYPALRSSKQQVIRIGEMLRRKISGEEPTDEVLRAFRIAYDWRNSHACPMKRIRHELMSRSRRVNATGITAARLKRMSSIRKKLARSPGNLAQVQDLGGCRAIVETMTDACTLITEYRGGKSVHEFRNETDYIAKPKGDGYRSYHVILAFHPKSDDEEKFDGRRIEVQIRTLLQHAWQLRSKRSDCFAATT